MSHFQKALSSLVANKPQAVWAERFGIDRTNLNKLLRSDVPCGHRTIAKILLGFPETQRKQLIFAYLMDEVGAITEAAANVTRRSQPLAGTRVNVDRATTAATRKIGMPIDQLGGLPTELREQLKRVIRLARDNPAIAHKLAMALSLADLR